MPWGRVEARPDQAILRVVRPALEGDLAVAAVYAIDGVVRRSAITASAPSSGAATAVTAASWARPKARLEMRAP